jgi:hypothetical protein
MAIQHSTIFANFITLTIQYERYGKSNGNSWNHIRTNCCLSILHLSILSGPFIVEEKGEEIPLVE